VYAAFTGPVSFEARVWAALLYAGRGATASHETAAQLDGLGAESDVIHVTIPIGRKVVPRPGLAVHRSRHVDQRRHPAREPPRTRVEETVLDLVHAAASLDEGLAVVMRAVQRRLTTADRLAAALARRGRLRWKELLRDALGDVSVGVSSLLERRYLRDVEHGHGLPRGTRQRARRRSLGREWLDVSYDGYQTVVELDGRVGHVEDGVFRDLDRDNWSAVDARWVLRYGWHDLHRRPCAVAQQVATVLRRNGWTGALEDCSRPACGVRSTR
jgi:hypothetical protein